MKKSLVLVVVLLMTTQIFSERIIEQGVVKEYQGRQDKTPLSKVQIKAKGCNWTTSDDAGLFKLEFNGIEVGQDIENVQIVKPGYVVFNKDVLKAWRLGRSLFEIVLCQESKLIERQQEYFNIHSARNNKECEKLRNQLQKERLSNKLTLEQYKEHIKKLEDDSIENMARIDIYAERFAYIDENTINETEYAALQLFLNNQVEEAIRLYEDLKIRQQLQTQMEMKEKGEKIIEQGKEIIAKSDSNSTILIRMLQQEVDLYKLGGKRYYTALISDLRTLIAAYRTYQEKTSNAELADALYELGIISEDDYDFQTAYTCFLEASELGNVFAHYHLAHLLETRSEYYDFEKARILYHKAADAGVPAAIERIENLWDFYKYNQNGCRVYYKILSNEKDSHMVKVTFNNLSYGSYDKCFKHIPSQVEHNGIIYDVVGVGKRAFAHTSITSIILPETIETIEKEAFLWTGLKRIELPKSLRYIHSTAFDANSELTEVPIAQNMQYFKKEGKLLLTKDGKRLLLCERDAKDTIIIPAGVEVIEALAFDFCKQIKYIQFPNSLKEIGDKAFRVCSNLEECILPEGLEKIGTEAFAECKKLKKVVIPNSANHIGSNIFTLCVSLNEIQVHPKNNLSITNGLLFSSSDKKCIISSSKANRGVITMPESVTELQKESFYDSHIFALNFSPNIDTISNQSLWFCKMFTAVIPEGVSVIEDEGLFVCRNMIELMLPSTITGIGNAAFYSADCLEEVYSFAKIPATCGHNAFDDRDSYITLHVPKGCSTLYKKKQGWKELDNIVDDLLCEEDVNTEILYSKDPQIQYSLALLRKSQCKYKEAISILEQIRPTTHDTILLTNIHLQKGLVFLQLGNISSASASLKTSLALLDKLPFGKDSITQTRLLERKMRISILCSLLDNNPRFFTTQYNKIFYDAAKIKNMRVLNELPSFFWIETEWYSYLSNYYPDMIEASPELFSAIFNLYNQLFDKYVSHQYRNLTTTSLNTVEERNLFHLQTTILNAYKHGMYKQCIELCDVAKIADFKRHRDADDESFLNINASRITDLQNCIEKYRTLSALKLQSIGDPLYIKQNAAKTAYEWCILNPADQEYNWAIKESCELLNIKYISYHDRISELIQYIKQDSIPQWNNNMRDMQEAIELYQKDESIHALNLFIDYAYKGYSKALSYIGRMCQSGEATLEDIEQAKMLYQLGIEHGDSALCNYFLGRIYVNENDFTRAASCFVSSNLILSYYELAQIIQYGYIQRYNLEDALSIYQQIKEFVSPSLRYTIDNHIYEIAIKYNELAYDAMQTKDNINEAIDYIDKAISLFPSEINFIDSKGELLLMSGDIEGALAMWNKVLEIDTDAIKHFEEQGLHSILYQKLKKLKVI